MTGLIPILASCPLAHLICLLSWFVPYQYNHQPQPNSLPNINEQYFDFIVIGAGAAGSVVASRLSENPEWKVLLIEAGGQEPSDANIPAYTQYSWGTSLDWMYKTEPQENACAGESCIWNAGKGLGGTTILNGMMYTRGNRRSYDKWAEMGNNGWSYKDVLYYFKKSERNLDSSSNPEYHGYNGLQPVQEFPYLDKNEQPFIKAFNELGMNLTDYNGERQTGVTKVEFFQNYGTRMTSYNSYIYPFLKDRKNIKVVSNTRVTKILINDKNVAYGVEYAGENLRSLTGKVYANKEVIVSAGALSSPRLLMLSGVGPSETLKTYGVKVVKDLPVGHNLQDHVTTDGFRLLLGTDSSSIPDNFQIVKDSLEYSRNHNGPLASEGTLAISAYIHSRYSDPDIDFPDIQYYLPPQYLYKTNNGLEAYLSPFAYYNSVFVQPAVLKPKSVGNLTIKSNDPFDDPVIYHNYFQFEEDLNILIDGCNFVTKKLMNTKAFRDLGIEVDKTAAPKCVHLEFGTDEYWTCAAKNHTGTTHHFGGSCKMGPTDDPTAVVDPELKVYGVDHLRVVDTSIIPILPNGNTQAPAQMIAEKAADMIKLAWGWKN